MHRGRRLEVQIVKEENDSIWGKTPSRSDPGSHQLVGPSSNDTIQLTSRRS